MFTDLFSWINGETTYSGNVFNSLEYFEDVELCYSKANMLPPQPEVVIKRFTLDEIKIYCSGSY